MHALALIAATGCAGLTPASDHGASAVLSDRQWSAVSSPNFTLYTDGAVEVATERLSVLERFRATCAIFADIELKAGQGRLRLVAPSDTLSYETLRLSESEPDGDYRSLRDGEFAVFSLSNRKYLSALSVALHEYVHRLYNQPGAAPIPLWYREGLAGYLATFEVESQVFVRVGGSESIRSRALHPQQWEDYRRLLLNPETVSTEQLYPQSWLLFQYMISEHHKSLGKYLSQYSRHDDEAAFEDAFGFPASDLHARMIVYATTPTFNALRLPVPAPRYEVIVEPMTAEETDYLLAHLGVGILPQGRLKALFAPFDKVGLPHLALAEELLYAEGDTAAASALVAQVEAQRPDDPRVQLMKARLLLLSSQSEASAPEDIARVQQAVRLANKAGRSATTRIEASTLVAQAGLMKEDAVPPSEIKQALTSALSFAPYRDDLLYLYLVYLSQFETPAEARPIADLLLSRTNDERIRAGIQEVFSELCQKHGDCGATSRPALQPPSE